MADDIRPGQIWRSPDGSKHVFVLDATEGHNLTTGAPSSIATVYPVTVTEAGWAPIEGASADELFTEGRRTGWSLYDHADMWATDGPLRLVSVSPHRYYDLPGRP